MKILSLYANKNIFNTLIFIILNILLCNKFAFCYIDFTINKNKQKNDISTYKDLDINNDKNKDKIFKVDLTANPIKNSNSFLQVTNHKELYWANFAISKGVKQYLHFHASVRKNKIIKK